MKPGDGGYRPSMNVQLATDADSQIIQRAGAAPKDYLVGWFD